MCVLPERLVRRLVRYSQVLARFPRFGSNCVLPPLGPTRAILFPAWLAVFCETEREAVTSRYPMDNRPFRDWRGPDVTPAPRFASNRQLPEGGGQPVRSCKYVFFAPPRRREFTGQNILARSLSGGRDIPNPSMNSHRRGGLPSIRTVRLCGS